MDSNIYYGARWSAYRHAQHALTSIINVSSYGTCNPVLPIGAATYLGSAGHESNKTEKSFSN
jgi:hypothetical protein